MDVIFDVDGTLLDIQHRVPLIRPTNGMPKDWKAFRAAASEDRQIWAVFQILAALAMVGHRVIIVTGRMESERPLLEQKIGTYLVENVPILMRTEDDFREDYVVKREILHSLRERGYKPEVAFDDRRQVVDMWREEGLICCQVAPGDF
jgi:FMN phosphatase YigB (HAD superfamily)